MLWIGMMNLLRYKHGLDVRYNLWLNKRQEIDTLE